MKGHDHLFGVLAALLLAAGGYAEEKQGRLKTVSTFLNAKWSQTPLALEVSEFLHDEDPALFWSFVDDSLLLDGSGSKLNHI